MEATNLKQEPKYMRILEGDDDQPEGATTSPSTDTEHSIVNTIDTSCSNISKRQNYNRIITKEDETVNTGNSQSPVEHESNNTANSVTSTTIYDLYIGKLHPDTSEKDLDAIFSRFGDLHSNIIIRAKSPPVSLCYGFVKFYNLQDAQQAIQYFERNPKYKEQQTIDDDILPFLHGKLCIKVTWAMRNRKLHVSNLNMNITQHSLTNAFSTFGKLESVNISPIASRNMNIAVVEYETREAAENALKSLNGIPFYGRSMHLEWYQVTPFTNISKKLVKRMKTKTPHYSCDVDTSSHAAANIVSLYVQFAILPFPNSANQNGEKRFMKESTLTNIFSRYGHVISASIKSSNINTNTNEQSGYAFIHYENNEDGRIAASTAIQTIMNQHDILYAPGIIIDNTHYTAQYSKNFLRGMYINGDSNPAAITEYSHMSSTNITNSPEKHKTSIMNHPHNCVDSAYNANAYPHMMLDPNNLYPVGYYYDPYQHEIYYMDMNYPLQTMHAVPNNMFYSYVYSNPSLNPTQYNYDYAHLVKSTPITTYPYPDYPQCMHQPIGSMHYSPVIANIQQEVPNQISNKSSNQGNTSVDFYNMRATNNTTDTNDTTT